MYREGTGAGQQPNAVGKQHPLTITAETPIAIFGRI